MCNLRRCLLSKPEDAQTYHHILRIQMVEGAHMAVDVTQVTLHPSRARVHTSAARFHALQVRHGEILPSPRSSRASRVLSHPSTNLLFSRRRARTLPALSAAAAAVAVAMGTAVWYRAEPFLPRTEKPMSGHVGGIKVHPRRSGK